MFPEVCLLFFPKNLILALLMVFGFPTAGEGAGGVAVGPRVVGGLCPGAERLCAEQSEGTMGDENTSASGHTRCVPLVSMQLAGTSSRVTKPPKPEVSSGGGRCCVGQ